jgi:lipid-A-disaccharide synthase
VKYITLVNLLSTDELFPRDLTPFDPAQEDAGRVLFPEYLTCEDKSTQIASHIVEWLTDRSQREQRVAELARLKAKVSAGGASRRAAEYILNVLAERPVPIPRPHFLPAAANTTVAVHV